MGDWTSAPLPEVLDFREGPGILAKDFHESGTPLVRLAGVKRGANLLQGCNWLLEDDVARRWSQFRLQRGDVLLSTSASLGEVAVVGPDGVGAVPYTGLIRFRPKDDRIDAAFIRHMLTAPSFVAQIQAMGVGSVMNHFGPTHLKFMDVAFPPPNEQRAIAEVLGALDDKIAANDRAASIADQRCAARVREAMSAGIHLRLRDVLRLNYGKALPASQRVPGRVIVFGSGGPTGTHDTVLVNHPGVIVGRKGTVGSVYWADGPHFPIDTTYFVDPIGGNEHEILYYVLRSLPLPELNSDSAVPGLNREEAYAQLVKVPTAEHSTTLGPELRTLFAWMRSVREESRRLARLRTALLPLLMSGKVRVRDAEKVLEEVV